jgi:hypothetical protein
MTRSLTLGLLLLTACGGGDTDDDAALRCGDPDGDGGDTGDVPSLIANWNGDFGDQWLQNTCPGDQVPESILDFLEQRFAVEGSVPDAIRLTFAGNPDLRLRGTATPSGAWAMSGPVVQGGVTMYTAIGGLVYEDASGRIRWDGGVFIGVDLNDDTVIDCEVRGDWSALRSTSS